MIISSSIAEKEYSVASALCEGSVGWAARAMACGLQVSYRPVKFGETRFFLENKTGDYISVFQGVKKNRTLKTAGFSAGQHSIAETLEECGLLVPKCQKNRKIDVK